VRRKPTEKDMSAKRETLERGLYIRKQRYGQPPVVFPAMGNGDGKRGGKRGKKNINGKGENMGGGANGRTFVAREGRGTSNGGQRSQAIQCEESSSGNSEGCGFI